MTATIRPDTHIDPAATPTEDDGPADAELTDAAQRDLEARLRARYPDVDPALVHAAVHDSYRAFDGARVRTFVPLLAENVARRTLRAHQATV